MNATFRDRDLRLLETVAPPYKVIPSADNTSWEYTSDPLGCPLEISSKKLQQLNIVYRYHGDY